MKKTHRHRIWFAFFTLQFVGCSAELTLESKVPSKVVAVFDLEEGVIPLPSDLLRDETIGRLDMPTDDETLTMADISFRNFMNTQDAWSTTFPAKVEFSGQIDPTTITKDTLQIWKKGEQNTRVEWEWEHETHAPDFEGPVVEINEDSTKITVNPPRYGWQRGGEYFFVLRGGPRGVLDAQSLPLGIDKAFYFMRQTQKLDKYEHHRAFPGDDRAERLETAADLEELRVKLSPLFDLLESKTLDSVYIPREEVAALWSFSVTQKPELAMDRSSQRMPIPCDVLIDPDTGLMDLQHAHWEEQLEADAKDQINELAGGAVSANPMFELSSGVDPATVNQDVVKVYEIADKGAAEIPLERIKIMNDDGEEACQISPPADDCKYIVPVIENDSLPLKPGARYAVVVFEGVKGVQGYPVQPMLMGHFLRTGQPLLKDGQNLISKVLSDKDAARLEGVRAKVAPLLDYLGRERIIAAWPFTTLSATEEPRKFVHKAEELGIPADPTVAKVTNIDWRNRTTPFQELFPGVIGALVNTAYGFRLENVAKIVEGTIKTPFFLGKETRAFREGGAYDIEEVKFLMTVPEGVKQNKPVPVVIFGHSIVTDSRFLLTIAGPLAKKGFAAVSIDLPYHGTRIACVDASLVSIPNFLPEMIRDWTGLDDDLLSAPPCLSGEEATCAPTGECLDAEGNVEPFNNFISIGDNPAIMDLKPVSGAAFLDIHDIPHIKDHFLQALTDTGALKHSLKNGDWQTIIGAPVDKEKLYYAGQSLGGIIGAVYTALDPDIKRSVLNVPGSDLIDLFIESQFFGPQVVEYFEEEAIVEGSYEHERFLNIARWIIDSIDPHSIAHLHRNSSLESFIQIDIGKPTGDIVIPNRTTRILERVSQIPVKEYNSNLHVDLIIPILGDGMLNDMADFLAGKIVK